MFSNRIWQKGQSLSFISTNETSESMSLWQTRSRKRYLTIMHNFLMKTKHNVSAEKPHQSIELKWIFFLDKDEALCPAADAWLKLGQAAGQSSKSTKKCATEGRRE